jgi:hypothetical protein
MLVSCEWKTLMDFNNWDEINCAINDGRYLQKDTISQVQFLWDNRHPYYGFLTSEGRQYYDEVKDAFPVLEIYPHSFSGEPVPIVTKDKHVHLWYRMNDFPNGSHAWKQLGDRPIVIVYIRSENQFAKYVFRAD